MTIGVVIIGRNEGERFKRCLQSLAELDVQKVYVDSGSTDGSVEYALAEGVDVVQLDASLPFAAGRARNEGFEKLLNLDPSIKYFQFMDGDCVLEAEWLNQARQALEANGELAIVCGRRRELFPSASAYNRLCDMEWNTPIGDAKACGGDFLVRAEAFKQVGGFNAGVIAGEEPELCCRLREQGWRIERLDAEMTRHDADMHRFGQFWQRAVRGGHAYAQGYALHRTNPDAPGLREIKSIVAWSLVIPMVILVLSGYSGWFIWMLAIYPVQALRIAYKERRRGAAQDVLFYGITTVIGKFAQLQGIVKYGLKHLQQAPPQIIEYK